MNLTISHTPTQDQIEEIKAWLIEEQNNSGEGFYCNWSIIASFYKRWNFSVISTNNKTIGFACWRNTSDLSGQINIFEIHPDFRRRGVGLYFTEKLLSHFVEKNVYVIDLQCVPSTSEIFWRYLGFTDVPLNIRYWDKQTQHLFKRLVPYQEESVA
jgi:ribosomal protein S18 acetylase RimI-like enzyme